MVKELFVRNGNFVNFPQNARKNSEGGFEQSSFLGTEETKKEAMKKGREFEKEGWKIVTIRGIWSKGDKKPYRYDIESWGGVRG